MSSDTSGTYEGRLRGEGLRVALACSRFNRFITDRLLEGAYDGLLRHGVDASSITVAWAPGAFELPLVAHRLAAGLGSPPAGGGRVGAPPGEKK